MRRLTGVLAGRRPDGERGAIAVLTATLVMFVAIGLLALTVDLGNITYNRAELQNGSDAASLALAAACAQPSATTSCGVSSSLTALAVQNANVSDQSMSILTNSQTCIGGRPYTGSTTLPTCAPPPTNATNLSSCQPLPANIDPSKVSYVEVTTQTEMKDGSNVLPFHFAQLLSGEGSGSTQETCSRAAWGAAGGTGATLPITMGLCDWTKATADGTKYAQAPSPQYTDPAPNTGSYPPKEAYDPASGINYTTGIFLQNSNASDTCDTTPNGGFSWLTQDTSAPGCTTSISTGDQATGYPGKAPPCDISSYLGQVVSVPIFGSFTLSGSNASYNIIGVAAFYLAGYKNIRASTGTQSVYTETSNVCSASVCGTGTVEYVWGWFVSSLLPVSTTLGGSQNMGAEVVVPAG